MPEDKARSKIQVLPENHGDYGIRCKRDAKLININFMYNTVYYEIKKTLEDTMVYGDQFTYKLTSLTPRCSHCCMITVFWNKFSFTFVSA
jgi:hypothetical protein